LGYCQSLPEQAKRRAAGALAVAEESKLLDTLFKVLGASRLR